MKRLAYIAILILILVSCGVNKDKFKLEGHLLNLNQGEFYIYALDGSIAGFDTIKVEAGRFTYETTCTEPSIAMIVFPNFSEQVVFLTPGEEINVSGDASHLKEIKIEGTDDNEQMTEFRAETSQATNAQTIAKAKEFIKEHPESAVSVYLLYRYFINTNTPQYAQAQKLLPPILQAQPRNGFLVKLQQTLIELTKVQVGKPLPSFSVKDLQGSLLTNKDLSTAQCAVITVWASWDYESVSQLNMLQEQCEKANGRLKLVSFNVDASKSDCKRTLSSKENIGRNVCEESLLGGKVMRSLGLFAPMNNILLSRGKVVGIDLSTDDLRKKVESLSQ